MINTEQHSKMAMRAARQLAKTSKKTVMSRSICYHLLMMIEGTEQRIRLEPRMNIESKPRLTPKRQHQLSF